MLGDYPSVKLTSENVSKAAEDRKYLTFIQNLLEASFNFLNPVQTVKFSPDNDTISYVICLANAITMANIIYWCKQVTRCVLAAKFYAIAHGFDIEK